MGLRRFDIVLWSAWVVASMVGFAVIFVTELRPLGVPFGYEPGQMGYELTLVLVGSAGIVLLQYVVFRVVLGNATLAAVAWVPIGVIVGVATYLAEYVWQTSPTLGASGNIQGIPTLWQIADSLILGLAQGVVLMKVFRLRSAIVLWPAATLIAVATDYVALNSGPILRALDGLPLLAALLAGNAIAGGLYGAVTGAALVALARRSARSAVPVTAPS